MLTAFSLEGDVVRLEPLHPDHAPGLAAAAATDRSSFGYTWVPDSPADARGYVQRAIAEREAGTSLPFAVVLRDGGQVVGSTRYLDLQVFRWPPAWPPGTSAPVPSDDAPPSVAEIGSTWYSAAVQRTSVNTECKRLLLGHAFDVWQVLRVTFKTDARNARSRAAIQRLGATFEGVRRAHVPATDGTVRDSAYFSILSEEWPAVRSRLTRR